MMRPFALALLLGSLLSTLPAPVAAQERPPAGEEEFRAARTAEGRRDYGEAVRLYRAAVRLRHPGAMHVLGHLYERGQGVPRSQEEAFRLFVRSAALGDATAAAHVYDSFRTGTAADRETALRVLMRRARGGDPAAQFYVGSLLLVGHGGLPPDYGLVADYLRRASAQQPPEDIRARARLLLMEVEVMERLDSESRRAGDTEASWALVRAYQGRSFLPPNPVLAHHYASRAARRGDLRSMVIVATLEGMGRGTEQSRQRAVRTLERALFLAEREEDWAALELGATVLIEGLGVPRDQARGQRLRRLAHSRME